MAKVNFATIAGSTHQIPAKDEKKMRVQELRAFHRHHRQAQRSIHCEREWDFACVCGTIACTHIVRNKDMDHSVIVVHGAGKCIDHVRRGHTPAARSLASFFLTPFIIVSRPAASSGDIGTW